MAVFAAYNLLPLALNSPVVVLRIVSGSMAPAINAGDLVAVNGWKKGRPAELVGKPVVFWDPIRAEWVVHRAVADQGGSLLTKGDNSPETDFFQPTGDFILGQAYRLPF